MENPGEIPKIWHGGIAIHGGLIGGFITGIIVCRTKNLHPFQIGDIVAPSIILAQGIGRWGNFMNHEAHGGPVSKAFLEHLHLPDFIIRNMYIDGQYYHPTFLYESLWDVLGFIILITLRKHLKLGKHFRLPYLVFYWTILCRGFENRQFNAYKSYSSGTTCFSDSYRNKYYFNYL